MKTAVEATESVSVGSVLRAAATMAFEADDVEQLLQSALDLVCAFTRWPVGHAYRVDAETGELLSTGLWHLDDPERAAPFVAATAATRLSPRQGLPGQILDTARPQWIENASVDRRFVRRKAAAASGLGAGFGFPIVTGRGAEGVLEFFAAAPGLPEPETVELLSQMGFQVGAAIDRLRAHLTQHALAVARDLSEANLADAQRIARMGSWSWRVGEDEVHWSDELHRIYGLEQGAGPVAFSEYLEHVHDSDRERVRVAVLRTLETLEPYEHEYRIVLPDDAIRWVHARGEVVEYADGRAIRLGGYCQDITARREAEDANAKAHVELHNQQRVMERIARGEPSQENLELMCRDIEVVYPGTRCTVLLADLDHGKLLHAAAPSMPAALTAALDGLRIEDGNGACGTAAAVNRIVVVDDIETSPLTVGYLQLAHAHGLRSVWSQPLLSGKGEMLGTFAVYRNESHTPDPDELRTVAAAASLAALSIDRDRAEQALSHAATYDSLTGLPNRAYFLQLVSDTLATGSHDVAVMFLDVDRFKWINDSLGHPAGDRVLVEIAGRLEHAVAGRGQVARFGGDEFTFVVLNRNGDVDSLADAVLAVFSEPFVVDGGEFFLSGSIGIATSGGSCDAYSLVRDADSAMFTAKDRGRGRRARFDTALRERSVARVRLESDLRRALERKELELHYQPVLDLTTNRWVAVEALVRWRHPERGLLRPDTFIPLAEDSGLIVPLGYQVLDAAVVQESAWVAAGLTILMTVNVSVVQLRDPSFTATLLHALEHSSVAATRMSLEITESALMDQLDDAVAALSAIADIGTTLAIDDFGTGHSSIARIRELPVATVKIDRRFVTGLGVDPGAHELLHAMTSLAHALGLQVIVEGVETELQLAHVRQAGADCAQGYLLSHPLPAADAEHVLRAPRFLRTQG